MLLRVMSRVRLAHDNIGVHTQAASNTWTQIQRMFAANSMDSLRLTPPSDLKLATIAEAQKLVEYSYQIGSFRHRSFESRGMIVKYKPQVLHML